ncbi:MAG: hypothetical protein ACOY3E_04125 [Pseudomonadota bacterium]
MKTHVYFNTHTVAKTIAGLAVVALLAMPSAWAVDAAPAKKPGIELTVKSFQEIDVTDKNGKVEKKTVPVAKIVPGDEVIYVISWKNNGAKPASDVVVSNPVPPQVTFVAGSAKAPGAKDEVSVDDGKTWGQLETLMVKADDGKLRPATGADVTVVQWKLSAPVAPGASGSVGYRAIVK